MRKSGLYVKKDIVSSVIARLLSVTKKNVLVGIPAEKTTRDTNEGITNSQLGYIHEFGAPEVNVPARPSLFPGVRGAKSRYMKYLERAARAMIDGKPAEADRLLNRAGLIASNAVKNKIRTGPFVPLAESTIKRRQRRSKGSRYRRKAQTADQVKPLIDTNQFLASHTYVVRDL